MTDTVPALFDLPGASYDLVTGGFVIHMVTERHRARPWRRG